MTSSLAVRIAAVSGFLAVALGAFGAHGLQNTLSENETTEVWKTAVFYHFSHALALLFISLQSRVRPGLVLTFLLGTVIFSGSLYVLAITNIRWLGAITPIGGMLFLTGWAWLVIAPGPKEQ